MTDHIRFQDAVLFLDELSDATTKVGDDRQKRGEVKRVVNTLLPGPNSLNDRIAIIETTNHPHLLDPAV